MKSLHAHLSALAHADPERPALLVCDTSGNITNEIPRAELLSRVRAAAAHLHRQGLRAGDRIALSFDNSADLLVLSWAAWSSGIVTIPLDVKRDTEKMREFKIQASGARVLLTQEFFPLVETASESDIRWIPDLSHEALILFTSGTTARPKGARRTLPNMGVNAKSIVDWLHINKDDRFLVELPLHHINSTTFCLASLIAGASIVIPPRYSNSHFWEQAANSGATLSSIVPSIVFDQLGRTEEFEVMKDRLKLNRIQLGSAPVVVSDAQEFMRKFSIPLYQGYGQTETALRVTGVPTDLPKDTYEKLVAENSIGVPMSWATVEVANAEGQILGENKEGELVVKGPAVMQGYLGDEPAFRDGYFLTGDIGYWKEIEDQRFFYLIGRSKEIIIKGGVNISPVAVEDALKKLNADVNQAYVIGVNDERYGEEVGAAIVWKADVEPESAMRRMKLTLLAGHEALSAYETPKYLANISAEALPITSTGKVQRAMLRKSLAGSMESLYELMQSAEFHFTVIPSHSPHTPASHALYNHCWQPLMKDERAYEKYLGDYLTLGAFDKDGSLAGQISFSYAGDKITCVSICSAAYKPKPVPTVAEIPSAEFVREYLLAGNDPVMNFHTKLGAELVEVTPNSRSEDMSSLGYTMILSYPATATPNLTGPVSAQLIGAVRTLAGDVGAEVFAVSRPGGLAAYLATHHAV